MGRPGEFYDQDNIPDPPAAYNGPSRAGRGVLYDQDGVPADNRRERRAEARQRRERDRLRDRELELRRERLAERDRKTQEARREAERNNPSSLLRISSRPGATTSEYLPDRPGAPAEANGNQRPALPGAPWTGPPLEHPPQPPAWEPPVSRGPAFGEPLPGAPWTAAAHPPATADQDREGPRATRRPEPRPSAAPAVPAAHAVGGRHRARRAQSTSEAAAVLAVGTFASRLTGFIRILVIGYVLGVGTLSDAFNYANGIPNIVYDLFLGGILAATLIPVFVEYLSDDTGAGARAISAITTAALAALAAITAVLWLAAPLVIRFYLILSPTATGGEERALATRLLHWFAPQVFLLGAIVVSTALLNARRRFTAAAFSPVLNNAIAIVALLATKFAASAVLSSTGGSPSETLDRFSHDGRAVIILGLGTTLGYAAQLLVQLPAQRRAGIRITPVWDLRHPAVRRVAALSSWLIGVVIANQLSLALIMILAGKTSGGLTAYQFSYQFFQLPYALIAVSVAAALMPDLSERWSRGDRRGFERQLVRGLRVTLALLVPIGLAYAAIAQPLIQIALHHGRVTEYGAHLVSSSLALFAIGLPGFSAFFLLIRAYQAMQDARTMFLIYALENGITVALAVIFDRLFGVPGLALAWIAPYTLACFIAAPGLRRRGVSLGGSTTIRAVLRIFVAGSISAAAVFGLGLILPEHASDLLLALRILAQTALGTVVYIAAARALRIRELDPVAGLLRQIAGRRFVAR